MQIWLYDLTAPNKGLHEGNPHIGPPRTAGKKSFFCLKNSEIIFLPLPADLRPYTQLESAGLRCERFPLGPCGLHHGTQSQKCPYDREERNSRFHQADRLTTLWIYMWKGNYRFQHMVHRSPGVMGQAAVVTLVTMATMPLSVYDSDIEHTSQSSRFQRDSPTIQTLSCAPTDIGFVPLS